MPFDQKTRNLLQNLVSECRRLLTTEFTTKLQELYGIQPTGTVADLPTLTHLTDEQLEVARLLRARIAHLEAGLLASGAKPDAAARDAVNRVIREQAFTVLNRLAALRLCEERGLVLECVRQGVNSEGFQLFLQSAGAGLGDTHDAYATYLRCLCDELALDLGVLFDRFSPLALLFPRRDTLNAVLAELNGAGSTAAREKLGPDDFAALWQADETIGWIYQYWNDPEERRKMRDPKQGGSAAPRNSRELAVRNQFFTPRYVVEFLTDNTLGRIWYEMTQGNTRLKDQCRYLVRRPTEIFLQPGEEPPASTPPSAATASPSPPANVLSSSPSPPAEGGEGRGEEGPSTPTDGLPLSRPPGTLSPAPREGESGVSKEPVVSQEDLLRQPVYIPHRPLKDPRTILMLDPACGSMHFGLYAFDLFEVIYEEYWDLTAGNPLSPTLSPARSGGEGDRRGVPDSNPSLAPAASGGAGQGEGATPSDPNPSLSPAQSGAERQGEGATPSDPNPSLSPAQSGAERQGEGATPSDPNPSLSPAQSGAERQGEGATPSNSKPSLSPAQSGGEGRGEGALHHLYPSKAAYLQDVPRLIIEHNLHGIDIDPRCVQIAGLSLWLRAQKSWQRLGVPPAERPAIRRSNIVCAEPMPGEKDLLREFFTREFPRTEQGVFGPLLEAIFDRMQLAGEAGSLLKIEEEIKTAITAAKQRWKEGPKLEQGVLFDEPARRPQQKQLTLDVSGITDAQFWERAEERIYTALRHYAEQAESGGAFQRRLFAEDAARGFAFIDICRQRYDVALMNPPFGDASLPSKPYVDDTYGDTRGDVYKAFVECFHYRLLPAGYLGIISSRTGFFLGQSEDWRTRVVLRLFRPIVLADLGSGVLDAMVEVAAYVLRNLNEQEARDLTLSLVPVLHKVERDRQDRFSVPKWQAARGGLKRHQAEAELEHLEAQGYIERCPGESVRYIPVWHSVEKVTAPPEAFFPLLVCARALDEQDKGATLLASLGDSPHSTRFACDPGGFKAIPGTRFAYWATVKVRQLFSRLPTVEQDERNVRIGDHPSDDFRWLRLFWEPPAVGAASGWRPYQKGGAFSRYYADIHLLVDWDATRTTYRGFVGRVGRSSERPSNSEFYFHPGVTWPRRSQKGASFRALPAGCAFSDKGPSVTFKNGHSTDILAVLALLNSEPFRGLIALQIAFGSYEVGAVQQTVLPVLNDSSIQRLAVPARAAWGTRRTPDTVVEASHAFHFPALIAAPGRVLADRAAFWAARVRGSEDIVAAIQAEIDDLAFRLYGLDAADRAALTATLATESTTDTESEPDEDEEDACPTADVPALTADLLAYALGCAFGRWDIRYATGEKAPPPDPDPFDPLPVCPPGQLQNASGLPLTEEEFEREYVVFPLSPSLSPALGGGEGVERARPLSSSLSPVSVGEGDGMRVGCAGAACSLSPAASGGEGRGEGERHDTPKQLYPLSIPWDGILVDDRDHPLDLERRVRDVIEVIWGASSPRPSPPLGAEERGSDAAAAGPVGRSEAREAHPETPASPEPRASDTPSSPSPRRGVEERVGESMSAPPTSPSPPQEERVGERRRSATPESIIAEACEILGVPSLREYFRKPSAFFADHLKRYSKSRRQAPIYWPLSTASGGYTLWIYYHRLTPDTLYKCLRQFIEPKIEDVTKQIGHLRHLLDSGEGTSKTRHQLDELEVLETELKEMRAELEHWAPRWKPNLNDGVLITACPLWRLFRLPKWRRDLEACWKSLEAGDYDWAHLAYTLWPDRVREKCKTDRSLAIAHDLEDICTVKAPEKKGRKAKKKDEDEDGGDQDEPALQLPMDDDPSPQPSPPPTGEREFGTPQVPRSSSSVRSTAPPTGEREFGTPRVPRSSSSVRSTAPPTGEREFGTPRVPRSSSSVRSTAPPTGERESDTPRAARSSSSVRSTAPPTGERESDTPRAARSSSSVRSTAPPTGERESGTLGAHQDSPRELPLPLGGGEGRGEGVPAPPPPPPPPLPRPTVPRSSAPSARYSATVSHGLATRGSVKSPRHSATSGSANASGRSSTPTS